MALLAPSILAADVLKLDEQVRTVEKNGADWIHVDVMDGHFVPNITFGPFMTEAVKKITSLPCDVHLMIEYPEKYIADFASSGADRITVHQEACVHLDRVVEQIHENGCKAGVALNPGTSVYTLERILEKTDLILVMTVNPGFGGQEFISYCLDKVRYLKQQISNRHLDCLVQVDGGINNQTITASRKAGVDVFVAGNAVFRASDIAASCRELKKLCSSPLQEV